ncbi:hypothetical protein SCAR479_01174 [Seiridium cardinale]|uniref:Uncharacterized protein n=1 Tax=Seiridium cardinale TaxID=138064 RepID=A0ABR2Y8J0_9PEZI
MSSAPDASLRNSTIITADGISPVLLDISPVCHYTMARPTADAQADVLQFVFNGTCEALLTPDAIEPGASLKLILNYKPAWWLNSLFNEFNATAGSDGRLYQPAYGIIRARNVERNTTINQPDQQGDRYKLGPGCMH